MKPHAVKFLIASALCATVALAPACAKKSNLILATTTSTQDTGLLDVLIPLFENSNNITVKTIAVGSGQAMALGRRGEADILLVHSPDAEKEFMDAGFGINRCIVMHNDFVILGPADDPAGAKKAKSAAEAFAKIAAKGALFVSRGDKSGTHVKELGLWKAAGVSPEGKAWYQETGLGMGRTLAVVAEKKGYTLSDRSTWLTMKGNLGLAVVSEGDATLRNIYHVIEVNPAKFPKVNAKAARLFSHFLVSTGVQKLIGEFGKDRFGQPLYIPDAVK
ncbi:MAG: substrate-binding domain-containing protein [Spirochaetes bacterium]|nr:substrate-binding domain-containing protein [Spirochaetota bacterium]